MGGSIVNASVSTIPEPGVKHMSEAREVRPVQFGQTGRVRTDFRPVDITTVEEEKKEQYPKGLGTGLTEPHVQAAPQKEGVEKIESPTHSSLTNSAEDMPESLSASPVESETSAKNIDVPEELNTDSGVDQMKPTEELTETLTTQTIPTMPTMPSLPSMKLPPLPF